MNVTLGGDLRAVPREGIPRGQWPGNQKQGHAVKSIDVMPSV